MVISTRPLNWLPDFMKVLIELDAEDGDLLDKLAEEQDRSRSAQARRMLIKAIWEATNRPLPLTYENDN